jgi:predicted RNase H-like nuclease (RuvC/YqgF family)
MPDRSADMRKRFTVLGILCAVMLCLVSPGLVLGQNPGEDLRIAYNRGLLSLSADNVNLNDVLTAVASETGITVTSPQGLEKQITTEFNGLPLQQGLRRILKGTNYALIYSTSPREKGGEVISGIYVLSQQSSRSGTTSRTAVRPKTQEERIAATIEQYEKKLDLLERRLEQVDPASPQGKTIDRQIRLIKQRIAKLQEQ